MTLISPAWTIWFDPGPTLKRIAHENPGHRLLMLPILAGLLMSPTAMLLHSGDGAPSAGFVWNSLLSFGPLLEVAQVFIGGWFLQVIGRALGGQADSMSVQAVVAWSNAPLLVLLLLWLLFALSDASFSIDGVELDSDLSDLLKLVVLGAAELAAIVWSFVILVRGLAAVQGLSWRRAALSVVLMWLLALTLLMIGANWAYGFFGLSEALWGDFA